MLWVFGSGLLFGLAILMKQPGGVFLLFAMLWLASEYAARRPKFRGVVLAETLLMLGACVALIATFFLLALSGVLERFWFWIFDYARYYGTGVSLRGGLENLRRATSNVFPQALIFWCLALVGIIRLATSEALRSFRVPLGMLVLLSFIGICPGLHFRPHYFILALPALCLLIGASGANLRIRPALALWVGAITFACVQSLYSQRALYFVMSPGEVSRSLYGSNPFPEAIGVGNYLREHTEPNDPIAVLGSEPEIFFYSGRRSATGYIYMYSLTEPQPFARKMQEDMIHEIESAHPAYVVLVNEPRSWLRQPSSEPLVFGWSKQFLHEGYQVAWHAGPSSEGSRPRLVVFKRNDFVPRVTN
jgi:hypothetical protein